MKSIKNFFAVSLFAVSAPVLAQDAQFSVRFANPQFDCSTGKARVQVQVKAQNAGKVFRMGDANYRFTYNPTQMRSPRIASEDGFSNKSIKKDLNYLPQTLQGSRELPTAGIVSLNTFYTGSGRSAAVVSADWQPVSTLEFEVLDWNKPVSLKWQNGKTFPITGMSSVKLATQSNEPDGFEYNLENTEGVGFQDLVVRPRDFCKASAPSVESGKMRMRINESAKICLPILDSDTDDTHTANLMGSSDKGKIALSVQDGSLCLNFAPNKDWTGREALLVNVCDKNGLCTTTQIEVVVARVGIHVYNGFSPNGDGVNDDLVIDGLENFPKHDLTIYNPNGIEVYHTTQYKNDWGGKWTIAGKEKLLVDGTYYYVLLDGEGQKHTGYIQIQR